MLNVIDRLPRSSAYAEALAEDEALAEQILEREEQGNAPPAPRRRVSDWTPTVEILTTIQDRMAELIQVVAMLGGAKPRQVPWAPRPRTAVQRVRRRQQIRKHEALVARVLPHKMTQAP